MADRTRDPPPGCNRIADGRRWVMNGFVRHPVCLPVEGRSGRYRHSFGGTWTRPAIPPGGEAPCHLLFTIDTADPLFPFRVADTRFLPLIYCQQYNAAALSYRVSGDTITIDWIESLDWDEDFPYDAYPPRFPLRDVTLRAADLERLAAEEAADGDTGTNQTRFGGWHWLCQGIPDVTCRTPGCGGGRMDVFAVVYNRPVEGVSLWEPDDGWCDVETIYQTCTACAAIQVCNRCT